MSKNLFDLLEDYDNEEPQVKVAAKPVAKTTPAAAPVGTKKVAAAEKPVATTNNNSGANRSGDRQRAPRAPGATGENRPPRVQRPPRVNADGVAVAAGEFKDSNKRDSKTHTRTPRLDANGQPRNRQFDRKSGTGRPINGENKKNGAGRGNWDKEGVNTPAEVAAVVKQDEVAAATAEGTPVVAEPPKEEDNTVTYDEYLKQQQKTALNQEALKLRQPTQGESEEWAGFVPLQREVAKAAAKPAKEEKKSKKNFINLESKPVIQNANKPTNTKKAGNPRSAKKPTEVPTITDFPELPKA
eukprot:gene7466-8735_t